jgi:hypothetical protein
MSGLRGTAIMDEYGIPDQIAQSSSGLTVTDPTPFENGFWDRCARCSGVRHFDKNQISIPKSDLICDGCVVVMAVIAATPPPVSPVVSCCDDFEKARQPETDNEGFGSLIEVTWRPEVTIFTIGQDLPGLRFCPWCGHDHKAPS